MAASVPYEFSGWFPGLRIDHFGQVGKAPYLMGVFGITAADIAKAARKAIARK